MAAKALKAIVKKGVEENAGDEGIKALNRDEYGLKKATINRSDVFELIFLLQKVLEFFTLAEINNNIYN